MVDAEWIAVKEAAALMDINPDYFRRTYCDPESPLVPIRQRRGKKGKRRIRVSRSAIMEILEQETRRPK